MLPLGDHRSCAFAALLYSSQQQYRSPLSKHEHDSGREQQQRGGEEPVVLPGRRQREPGAFRPPKFKFPHGGIVAVNALLDDLTIQDPHARLWAQTERLKAALSAARMTGEVQYWSMAHAAALSILPYLDTPLPGLWFDAQRPNGEIVDSPAPASTFYHLVVAIAALNSALLRCA